MMLYWIKRSGRREQVTPNYKGKAKDEEDSTYVYNFLGAKIFNKTCHFFIFMIYTLILLKLNNYSLCVVS